MIINFYFSNKVFEMVRWVLLHNEANRNQHYFFPFKPDVCKVDFTCKLLPEAVTLIIYSDAVV